MRNVRTAVWVLGVVGLAGCVGNGTVSRLASGGVDSTSSSAEAVREASAHPYPYPDVKRLPLVPRDVRPLPAFGVQAAALRQDRDGLQTWAATHPAMVDDTDAYAERARGRGADPAGPAPPPDQSQRSEAWAARLRAVAKPPPPAG